MTSPYADLVAQRVHDRIGCGPIVTRDDPDDDPNGWDAELMGDVPKRLPVRVLPGTWRWDVPSQRWVPYAPVPG